MKQLSIFLALAAATLSANAASAEPLALARELINLTYAGERQVAPPAAPGLQPTQREAHFREVAAGFYAKKLSEVELTDIVGFYRSRAGSRLLRTEDKIEKEVMVVAFTSMLSPPKTAATAASAEPAAEPDPRLALAEQLLSTPIFAERIARNAASYDAIRAGTPGAEASASKGSDVIRELYTERYAKRFSGRVLRELFAFYDSKLGRKYAKLQSELGAYLEKEQERYG